MHQTAVFNTFITWSYHSVSNSYSAKCEGNRPCTSSCDWMPNKVPVPCYTFELAHCYGACSRLVPCGKLLSHIKPCINALIGWAVKLKGDRSGGVVTVAWVWATYLYQGTSLKNWGLLESAECRLAINTFPCNLHTPAMLYSSCHWWLMTRRGCLARLMLRC